MDWNRLRRFIRRTGYPSPAIGDGGFDDEQFAITGFWKLDCDHQHVVIDLLVDDLGPVVSAMWSTTMPMPMEILESRMARFPAEEVWMTHRRLANVVAEDRDSVIRTTAMLYNIAMAEIKVGEREPGCDPSI